MRSEPRAVATGPAVEFETAEEERQRLADFAGRSLLDRVERRLRAQICDEEDWPPADEELDMYYYNGWDFLINMRASGELL